MPPEDKARENRLRRMAARQELRLVRSRRRDRRAVDYDTYTVVDVHGDTLVDAGERMTIDDVEEYLTGA